MHSLILFASGKGSNVAAIHAYFKENGKAKVALIVSNNKDAGVLEFATQENIPFLIIDRKTFKEELLVEQIRDFDPSLVVLAGFLWKVPESLIRAFPGQIINIHPALLPKYGGKGMYGHHVHHAVIEAKELQSGITIHEVNEAYDEGRILLQASCAVSEDDTPDSLAANIHKLEHFYFPRTIEFLLSGK